MCKDLRSHTCSLLKNNMHSGLRRPWNKFLNHQSLKWDTILHIVQFFTCSVKDLHQHKRTHKHKPPQKGKQDAAVQTSSLPPSLPFRGITRKYMYHSKPAPTAGKWCVWGRLYTLYVMFLPVFVFSVWGVCFPFLHICTLTSTFIFFVHAYRLRCAHMCSCVRLPSRVNSSVPLHSSNSPRWALGSWCPCASGV